MLFPDSASRAISEAFYDKKFEVFTFETQLGLEGDTTKVFQRVGECSGNVRFANLAKLREELGLMDEIQIAISCDKSVEVKSGDFIEFEKIKYFAFEVIPFDSHLMILGRKDG